LLIHTYCLVHGLYIPTTIRGPEDEVVPNGRHVLPASINLKRYVSSKSRR